VACSADDVSVFAMVNSAGAVNKLFQAIALALGTWQRSHRIAVSLKSCCAVHNIDDFARHMPKGRARAADDVRRAIGPFRVASLVIAPSIGASDPPIKNLGVIWSARENVFSAHVDMLLANHARGLQLILPAVNSTTLPRLLQAYNAFALGTWIHSAPLVALMLPPQEVRRLDQHHAQSLKRLAYMPASTNNMAAIYECGSRPFLDIARERLVALREQLVRVLEASQRAQQPLALVQRALAAIDRSYPPLGLPAPQPVVRAAVTWDAAPVDPGLFHLAERVSFALEHEFSAAEKELLFSMPGSQQVAALKAAANQRRRAVITAAFPVRVELYHDGSVLCPQGHDSLAGAGAASTLYLRVEDAEPFRSALFPAPADTCSFWTESIGSNGGLELVVSSLGVIPIGSVLVCWSDSLSRLQQLAAGPARATSPECARGWQLLLQILARGGASRIILAHHYSHVDDDARTALVDCRAKEAAVTLAGSDACLQAPRWWKDDARMALRDCLNSSAEQNLASAAIRQLGPTCPTEWKSGCNPLGPQGCRRLAQLRAGACPALGGFLHGSEHVATCGACGQRVGRCEGADNPTLHLFLCRGLASLRVARGMQSPDTLWKHNPAVVLRFVHDACKASRNGIHAKGANTLGVGWPDDLGDSSTPSTPSVSPSPSTPPSQ
jgi:hypothetical protein